MSRGCRGSRNRAGGAPRLPEKMRDRGQYSRERRASFAQTTSLLGVTADVASLGGMKIARLGCLALAASVVGAGTPPLRADPVPVEKASAQTKVRAVIVSDWMEGKEAATEDAKKKALAKALNAYEIVETRVRLKGKLRRVTLVIEYVP